MKPLTTRQKQSIETRKRIFEAATELFIEKSYENVKIRDICEKAKVSIGSFYHYFNSKESILGEGYRFFDQTLEEEFEKFHPSSPLHALRFLITQQLSATEKRGVYYSVQYFKNQLSSEEKYIIDENRFLHQAFYKHLKKLVQESGLAVDAEEALHAVFVATRGVIYDWCLREGSYNVIERGLVAMDQVLCYYGLVPGKTEK